MTTYQLVASSIALGVVAVPIVTWAVLWLVRRDRIFANLTPGEIPADPDEALTQYVSHGAHYWGEVESRATPPAGVSPGLAGVVIDGSADGRDIAAMILDLARRGWLTLRQGDGTETESGDWAITRVDQPLDASLDLNEVHLITNIATPGGTAWLSELCGGSDNRLALVQQDLHREVVARGWYAAPPHQTSDIPMAVLGVGGLLGLVIALIDPSTVSIGAGAVILACAYLTSLIVRGGTPRTALGTAVRIQALGLRRYLEEAQSFQFSYTDAVDIFRTYLPWAVVFELENQWADVFATLDVVANTSELHFARDLGWFADIRDRDRAVPPGVPVGESTAPRRGAYSEEDVVSTVLMSAEEAAAERRVAAKVTVAQHLQTQSGTLAAREFGSGGGSGIGPAVRRTASSLAGFWRRPRPESTEDTHRIVPLSPATAAPLASPEPAAVAELSAVETPTALAGETEPVVVAETERSVVAEAEPSVVAEAEPGVAAEALPSVRQWVPKESTRTVALQPRPKPPVKASSTPPGPAAPVTPIRATAVAEAPATPARAAEDPGVAAAMPGVGQKKVRSVARDPRSDDARFADWMSELDLAMTGDVDEWDIEATEGGTVISGPERFDVLLTPPLWPDVPSADLRQ